MNRLWASLIFVPALLMTASLPALAQSVPVAVPTGAPGGTTVAGAPASPSSSGSAISPPITTAQAAAPASSTDGAARPAEVAPSLDTARQQEKAGDTAGAIAEYLSWLAKNGSSPDFSSVLLHTATLEPTVDDALRVLGGHLATVTDPADRGAVYGAEARLEELARNIDSAQHFFEMAYLESPSDNRDYRSLLRSANLLLELGKISDASERATTLDAAVGAAAVSDPAASLWPAVMLLRGRIVEIQSGDAAAFSALAPVATQTRATPALLLFLVEAGVAAGRSADVTPIIQTMKNRFPHSPEYALAVRDVAIPAGAADPSVNPATGSSSPAAATSISYLPTAGRLLAPFGTPGHLTASVAADVQQPAKPVSRAPADSGPATGSTPAPATGSPAPIGATPVTVPASQPGPTSPAATASGPAPISPSAGVGTVVAIAQAGLFQSEKNASELQSKLADSGLAAAVRKIVRDSKSYFQVYVPIASQSGSDSEESAATQQVLLQLKSFGIDAFLTAPE